jgi:quinol monooxygenase YgiN
MGGEISWHVVLRIKPGQLDNFRTLTGEMVAVTRRERGILSYQRFVSDDGTIIHVYERYADSAAAVAHLGAFMKRFAARFSAMVERKAFTVFGHPSAELKAVLNRFNATYLKPFGDFAYWA